VNAIPDAQRNSCEVPNINDMENPTVFGSIGIELLGDSIVTIFEPSSDFVLDSVNVFQGPSEFCINAG
jgi:hypothetical protein